jgi:hypothetical protein
MHLPPMFHELGLSGDQREKIFVIMERRRPEFDAVMSEMAPRMRAIGDSIDEELRQILTEAQQKKLAELKERPPPIGFGPPPCRPGEPCPPPGRRIILSPGHPGPRGMGPPPFPPPCPPPPPPPP